MISLEKGQKVDLSKGNGDQLEKIFLGLNWGAIEKDGFFGKSTEAVDLDGSCIAFTKSGEVIDAIYYGNLETDDNSIKHSGDDLTGDVDGDDGLDNEVISVDLSSLKEDIEEIYFVLNSFKGQDFATVPFATIRIYEGDFNRVDEIFAKYDVAHDPKFSGYVAMIMGKLYRRDGQWRFSAMGESSRSDSLKNTLLDIKDRFF
jgi:tellurium resistance protein TerZ